MYDSAACQLGTQESDEQCVEVSSDEDSNSTAVMERCSEDESGADGWHRDVDWQAWERVARGDDERPTLTIFGDGGKLNEVSKLPGVRLQDAGCVSEDEQPDFGEGCGIMLSAKQRRQLQDRLQAAKTKLVVQSAEYHGPVDNCKYNIAPVPRWTLPMLSERI